MVGYLAVLVGLGHAENVVHCCGCWEECLGKHVLVIVLKPCSCAVLAVPLEAVGEPACCHSARGYGKAYKCQSFDLRKKHICIGTERKKW